VIVENLEGVPLGGDERGSVVGAFLDRGNDVGVFDRVVGDGGDGFSGGEGAGEDGGEVDFGAAAQRVCQDGPAVGGGRVKDVLQRAGTSAGISNTWNEQRRLTKGDDFRE
jgi:hypothetical protein